MNISFVSSEKFLVGARVMLVSFLENNKFEKHNIYWLYTDVNQKAIDEFCGFFEKRYGQKVTPFRMTDEMMKGFYTDKTFGVAAFHKLFVFRHLDTPGGRILSLDADAVVNGSLKDFYYQEMGENCIASSPDLYIRETDDDYITDTLGLPKDHTYINLGNTLFNLDKYLPAVSTEVCAEYVKNNPEKLRYVAQDVLNVMLKDRIKVCDVYKYNLQIFSEMNMKHSRFYLKNDDRGIKVRNALKNDPVIVHYVRKAKPWDTNYIFGDRRFFKKYEIIAYGRGYVMKKELKRCWYFIEKLAKKGLKIVGKH
ncbi:MAG: hypothetical protein K5979_08775 [Ruminococcus sp.]|nr:hypothetical protein [Ruminococcus sp.]